jgi:hypothetical protein
MSVNAAIRPHPRHHSQKGETLMRSAAPQRPFVEGDIAKHFGGARSFINEKELAEYLNMAAGSLAVIRKAGLGPRWFRVGLRQIGYRPADVESWLLARENVMPTPTPAAPASAAPAPSYA